MSCGRKRGEEEKLEVNIIKTHYKHGCNCQRIINFLIHLYLSTIKRKKNMMKLKLEEKKNLYFFMTHMNKSVVDNKNPNPM